MLHTTPVIIVLHVGGLPVSYLTDKKLKYGVFYILDIILISSFYQFYMQFDHRETLYDRYYVKRE